MWAWVWVCGCVGVRVCGVWLRTWICFEFCPTSSNKNFFKKKKKTKKEHLTRPICSNILKKPAKFSKINIDFCKPVERVQTTEKYRPHPKGGRGEKWEAVDVMSVTVVRMTVARQSLNRAYSVSHQNQRKKLRTRKLQGP